MLVGRSELLDSPWATRGEPARAREAAQQFEALLLQHLLKTAREAGESEEESSLTGGETYLEVAEQYLAQALASRGGFGIARLILKDLSP
jgi:flagellar protein FlgJ